MATLMALIRAILKSKYWVWVVDDFVFLRKLLSLNFSDVVDGVKMQKFDIFDKNLKLFIIL